MVLRGMRHRLREQPCPKWKYGVCRGLWAKVSELLRLPHGFSVASSGRIALRQGLCGGRGASLHAKLLKDVLHVLLHGARARVQDRRNVSVCLAAAEPGQHLGLTAREAEPVNALWRRKGLFKEQQSPILTTKQAHG